MIAKIHHNLYKFVSFLLLHKAAFCQNLSKRRRQKRQNCHIPVELIHHSTRFSGVIRNISAVGARVDAHNDLPVGEKVELCFPLHYLDAPVEIIASIVWADSRSIGIQFDTP